MRTAPIMVLVKDFVLLVCRALDASGYPASPLEVRDSSQLGLQQGYIVFGLEFEISNIKALPGHQPGSTLLCPGRLELATHEAIFLPKLPGILAPTDQQGMLLRLGSSDTPFIL